jgi:hypothetical protein
MAVRVPCDPLLLLTIGEVAPSKGFGAGKLDALAGQNE